MVLPLPLHLVLPSQIEVRSADERLLAKIVPSDEGARRAEVFATAGGEPRLVWSAPYPAAADGERDLLVPGAEGEAWLARVVPFLASADDAPVALFGPSKDSAPAPLRAWSAPELHVAFDALTDAGAGRRWLAEDEGAARVLAIEEPWGARVELRLDLADGRGAAIDLWTGRVRAASHAIEPMSWSPRAESPEEHHLPYVVDLERLELLADGVPAELVMHGSFPTHGWKLDGFALRAERRAPRERFGPGSSSIELSIEPVCEPPPASSPQRAALKPFQERLTLRDLPPGDYTLRAISLGGPDRGSWPFTVLEPTLVVSLHATGGFAGIDRRTSVYADGWVERGGTRPLPKSAPFFRMQEAQRAELARMLAELPARSFTATSSVGADLVQCELVWLDHGTALRVVTDDATAEGRYAELIRLLQGLGSE